MESYPGTYSALVADANDTTGSGRARLYVPQVHGTATTTWAVPVGPGYAVAGDQVVMAYAGGDPNYPVYWPTNIAQAGSGNPWASVVAYGATGNGTTDDTHAIQLAITAVGAAGGGVVYFPATAHGYLLNSVGLTMPTSGVVLLGAGAENTKLLIGSSFAGTTAVLITGYNCQVRDLSISGASSTTTSNPVADAIEISGARRTKIGRVSFFNVNGWAIEALSTTASASSNPLGTQISQVYMNACAGGVHFLGNTTQGYAMNSQITDMQFYLGGVTSGASANLDAIRIEDAWDVLAENVIAWMSVGTGSCLHIKGTSAASFIKTLDSLGPTTGPCVLIEDGPNGSPQNTQIIGGVIQQGSVGLQISGGAFQTHISTMRIINNQTHGMVVSGSGRPIHLYNILFNLNGAGAAGTNYDLNWSGTAEGEVGDCWFGSSIVSTGTAGVQQSINMASSGQAVMVSGAAFQGTGAGTSNWFNTNLPAGVQESSYGVVNFATNVDFSGTPTSLTVKNNQVHQPSSSANTVASINVSGADPFDRWRLLGSGAMAIGSGSAARDVQLARSGTGVLAVTNPATAHGAVQTIDGNLLVGGTAVLGDNGIGELQLADANTVATTNPTAGTVVYSQSATAAPVRLRDTSGNVRSLADAYVVSSATETTTSTAQGASTHVVVAVEASATYLMSADLTIETPSAVNFTHSWTGPSGATMTWSDAAGTYLSTIGAVDTWSGTGSAKSAHLKGVLTTSTTAGSLTVTFASGTSGQTAQLLAGSFVRLARVK